jgi:hypothetical protein
VGTLVSDWQPAIGVGHGYRGQAVGSESEMNVERPMRAVLTLSVNRLRRDLWNAGPGTLGTVAASTRLIVSHLSTSPAKRRSTHEDSQRYFAFPKSTV